MFWREQRIGDETIVRFTGILDATSAREVKRFLSANEPGRVVLDFSQARDIDYYGLSVLATAMAGSGRTVLLRGLHVNHIRMLRYFGVDPADHGVSDCGPWLDAG